SWTTASPNHCRHRVGVNLEHARCGPNTQAFSQTRQCAYDQLHGDLLPMKECAMMLGKIAFTGSAVELAPETATRMAVGTEIAQPEPAVIATAHMGTEVLGGIDRARASMRRRHWVGAHSRGRLGRRDILRTQGAARLLGQAGKRFGVVGVLAGSRDGCSGLR